MLKQLNESFTDESLDEKGRKMTMGCWLLPNQPPLPLTRKVYAYARRYAVASDSTKLLKIKILIVHW